MTTFSRLKTIGRGVLGYRLEIEGWPHVWTTSGRITFATNAAGRSVYPALAFDGLKITEKSIMRDAWIEPQGMTCTIRSTRAVDEAVSSFTRDVSAPCNLGAALTTVSSSITTDDGSTLAGAQVYHIATEAILMTGGNVITSRGVWGTAAQNHPVVTDTGAPLPNPIFSWPPTMDGRRARLFAYGDTDDPAGDGTQIWIGIVSRPPRMSANGCEWQLTIDPVTKLLEQSVAANESRAYHPRGIYHTCNSPFVIQIEKNAVLYEEVIEGFYESDVEFAAAVEAKLQTLMTAASFTEVTSMHYSIVGGVQSLTLNTGTIATGYGEMNIVMFGSILEGEISPPKGRHIGNFFYANNTPYVLTGSAQLSAAGRPNPWGAQLSPVRGVLGAIDYTPNNATWQRILATPAPQMVMYLDSVDGLAADNVVIIRNKGASGASGTNIIAQIIGAPDTSTKSVYLSFVSGAPTGVVFYDADIEIIPIRNYATRGNLADFITGVINQAPDANGGDTPYILNADVDTAQWSQAIVAAGPSLYMSSRRYDYFKPVPVKDVVCEEAKALGVMLRLGADGRLNLIALPRLTTTQTPMRAITDADLLTPMNGKGQWPLWEEQADGLVSVVQYRSIYLPHDDSFDAGGDVTLRDIPSIAQHKNRGKGEVTIAPKSTSDGTQPGFFAMGSLDSELAFIVNGYMAILSRDYAQVTLQVPWTFFDTLVGDIVALTSRYIPDGRGGRGVSGRLAFVVAREWPLDPKAASGGTLTLYISRNTGATAGYTPSGRVTAQSHISANIWDLTLDSSNPYNLLWSEDGSGDVQLKFLVGFKVRVVKVDDPTPTEVKGVVTSSVPSFLRVDFGGSTWTPGADTWNLIFQKDDGTLPAAQTQYAYVASPSRHLNDGSRAREFA